jgi:hypothetical protein
LQGVLGEAGIDQVPVVHVDGGQQHPGQEHHRGGAEERHREVPLQPRSERDRFADRGPGCSTTGIIRLAP